MPHLQTILQKEVLEMKRENQQQRLKSTVEVKHDNPLVCHCDNRYVGRTSQHLQNRIRQHVPKSIRNRTSQERKQPERPGKLANSIPHCDSAIGNHLLHNQKCASYYKDNQFFILSKARSDFHLSVLESIFITLRKPNLCRQKEFVYKHKLLV